MTTARKLTPEEVLREVERMEAEEQAEEDREIARILAESPEKVRADLAAAGVDMEKERAKAEVIQKRAAALGSSLAPASGGPPGGARVIPSRSNVRRFPLRTLLIAAAVVAVCAAAAAARHRIARLFTHLERDEQFAPPNDFTPAQIAARQLDDAVDACRDKRWDDCKALLDQAESKDPDLEKDQRSVRLTWAIEKSSIDPTLPWAEKAIGPGSLPPPKPAGSGIERLKAPR